MRTAILSLALVFSGLVTGCADTARPVPSSFIPATTVAPIDQFVAEVEFITGSTVRDRTAIVSAAFQICTQVQMIDDPDLYSRAVNAFSEGAMLPPDKGELLMDSALRFACPDEYQRTRRFAPR